MNKTPAFLSFGCALLSSLSFFASPCDGAQVSTTRENFDFDWIFRYFGPGDPEDSSYNIRASSTQRGNMAFMAIDGNENTRWCANDGKPGHSLSLDIGAKDRIETIRFHWENNRPQTIELELSSNGRLERREFRKDSEHTEIKVGGRKLESIKLTFKGTGPGNWASVREIVLLDAEGKEVKAQPGNPADAPAQLDYTAKGFKPVQLPHDWAIESEFLRDEPNETGKLPWNGYGWYRKEFDVPSGFSEENERYYLDFEGVMSHPKIYVNGQKAGEWAYGYASFRVDITPYLKPGKKNLVAVLASNRPRSTRWYPGAGIYRHVWLEHTAPVHVAYNGIFVTTPTVEKDHAVVHVKTEVENTGVTPAEVTVEQNVGDLKAEPVKVIVAPGETTEVDQVIRMKNPKLWSCEHPELYTLTTKLSQNGSVDERKTTFGVRKIEWRPEGFFLNGKRVKLNGVCEHHDLGPLGAAFHARAFERKIEILKGMGCNSIRTSHNPPAPEVLDLCDKHGILVLDELFDIWKLQKYDKVNGYHLDWPTWWKKDVANFIRRDRNHPCVIGWSGGNEIAEISKPEGVSISTNLRKEIRRHDTTRPYTVGNNAAIGATNGFGDTQDSFGYNYKPWLYKEYAHNLRPNMPFYASETASCCSTRDTYFFPLRWNVGGGARSFQVSSYGVFAPSWGYCPDVEFFAQDAEPNVAGEYVWTGFDYIGEPTPYNQDASNVGNFQDMSEEEKNAAMARLKEMGNKAPSRSSYFGIIDLAGFPKDTYYLYMSKWAPEKAHAHLLPHWNWRGREGQVTPVMCFSSGDEAELFVNGKSQGVRRKGEGPTFSQARLNVPKNAYRFVWEDVKYEPGEIKVVVKKKGKLWAKARRVTTGNTSAVTASVDRSTIANDGHDLSFISLSLVDARGNVVPTDSRAVTFSIDGPAELIGFCNGNPIDQTCMQSKNQSFFNGRILAVVRGLRGKTGVATVTVKTKGLQEIQVPVKVSRSVKD